MGVSMEEVSAWLGHSSISTTEKVYAHITVAMRRRAAGVLDQFMGYKSLDRGKPKDIRQAISKLFELWENTGENIYHVDFLSKKRFEPSFEPDENMQHIQE